MPISTSIPTNFHIRDTDLGSILVSREYLSTTYRSLIDDRTRSDAYWWGANYSINEIPPMRANNEDTRRLNYLQRESADWNSPSSTGNLFYTKEIVDIQHNQTVFPSFGWQKRITSFIASDGTLWMSGYNLSGQLGQPYSSGASYYQYFARGAPFQVGSSNDWILCAPGTSLTLAIKRDGTLWAWGRNEYGVAGTGADTSNNDITNWGRVFEPPTDITSMVKSSTYTYLNKKWRHVSCGYLFAMFIDEEGYLYGSGRNNHGQLGNFSTTDSGGYMKRVYDNPNVPGYDDKWRYVQAGLNSWIGIKEDGRLYGCGDLFGTRYPIELRETWYDFGRRYIHCDISHSHWAAIRDDGTLWTGGPYNYSVGTRNACFGQHENFDFTDPPLIYNNLIGPAPQSSDPDGPGRILKVAGGPFRYVTCGFWVTILIGADGRLYGYGNSGDHQLNPNSTLWIYQPQLLEYNKTVQYSNWRQVKAQDYGCLGLNSTQYM